MIRSERLKNELVDILDYWSYLLCKDEDISRDMFYEVRLEPAMWDDFNHQKMRKLIYTNQYFEYKT